MTRNPCRSSRRRANGFTLVEVLVVIGIIAILIGILLPTISRARAVAVRTQCASNLHQMGMVYFAYASENHDRVPIGTDSLNKQSNFWFYETGDPSVVMFGLLNESRLLKDPRVAFCPASSDALQMYDGVPSNRWPYKIGSSHSVRAGYSMRGDFRMDWTLVTGSTTLYKLDCQAFLKNGPTDTGSNFGPVRNLPQQQDFFHKSIISDLIRDNTTIVKTHGNGMNYLYYDGSVHWLPVQFVEPYVKTITPTFTDTNNPAIDALWNLMDSKA